MKLWSQLARLWAAVAAFGPPVLAEAEDEPEQAALPTLDAGSQPVAAATIGTPQADIDVIEVEVMGRTPTPYVAALPAPTATLTPLDETHRQRGDKSRVEPKPHGAAKPRARNWYGGGQRYG